MIDNGDYPPNIHAPFNSKYHLDRGRDILKYALINGVPEQEYLKDYHAVISEATELSHEVIRCRGYHEVSKLLRDVL